MALSAIQIIFRHRPGLAQRKKRGCGFWVILALETDDAKNVRDALFRFYPRQYSHRFKMVDDNAYDDGKALRWISDNMFDIYPTMLSKLF